MITFELIRGLLDEMVGGGVEITPDCQLHDLGLDSLDMLQLFQTLEQSINQPIDVMKINGNLTLSELITMINRQ